MLPSGVGIYAAVDPGRTDESRHPCTARMYPRLRGAAHTQRRSGSERGLRVETLITRVSCAAVVVVGCRCGPRRCTMTILYCHSHCGSLHEQVYRWRPVIASKQPASRTTRSRGVPLDRSDVFSLSANHISVYTHPWEAEPSLLKNSAIAQALVRRMKAERWPAVFECLNLTLFL